MKLNDVARAYVSAVELEERLTKEAPDLAEDMSLLRADLHALLMEALRENDIPFVDRAAAARIAFELVHQATSR